MKIWILGAQGLVGSNLIPKLHKHQVIGTDVVTDVRALNLKSEVPDVDLIINLAALNSSKDSLERPRDYFETNVVGNYNLLEIAKGIGAKYMYLTTPKAIELTPYGVSKQNAERWCQVFQEAYKMPIIINRVGNLYGPGGDNFWVNIFMQKAKNNEPIEVWGTLPVDVLYIDDLIDLLVQQINNFEKYQDGIHEVGGGVNNLLSTKQLLEWLKYDNYTEKELYRGGSVTRYTNNTPVTNITGWQPTTSLEDGLKLTYDSI